MSGRWGPEFHKFFPLVRSKAPVGGSSARGFRLVGVTSSVFTFLRAVASSAVNAKAQVLNAKAQVLKGEMPSGPSGDMGYV